MKLLIFVCTLVYLCVELALNAAILDLVAPGIDHLSVQKIQNVSGAMGGFGIGLIIVRLALHRLPHGNSITVPNLSVATIIVLVCAVLVGQAQSVLVNSLVARTNGEQRKDAVVVVSATYGLMSQVYKPANLNLAPNFTDDPTSRAAIILFSPFVIWGGALNQLEDQARRIVKNTIYQRSPSIRPDFEDAAQRTCKVFNDSYREYAAAATDTRRKWAPKRFNEAYKNKRDEFLGYTGSLPLGLPKSEFVRHPDIQGYVRHEIFSAVANYPLSPQVSAVVSRQEMLDGLNRLFARKVLDPCMNWSDFRREYVGGIINYVDSIIGASIDQKELQALENGGRFEELGRNAVLAAIGPPLAFAWFLLISVVGISFAAYWLLHEVFKAGRFLSLTFMAAILVVVFYIPLQTQNAVVDSPAFSQRENEIKASIGAVPFSTFVWVLKTAPFIYPLTSALRDQGPGVLLGINRS